MGKRSPPLYLCEDWSEAKFKGKLKSALRSASQHWPPIAQAIKRVERKVEVGQYKNGNTKYKTQHQCEECKNWFDKVRNKKGDLVPYVQVDHITPLGGWSEDITKWAEDLGEMYKRAFCKLEDLMCLCPDCHKIKTDRERETGAWKRK